MIGALLLADGPLLSHSSVALMAFSPQIAPLERFALRGGSKSPTRGEVPPCGLGTIEPQARLFTSPFMGEAGRGPSASVGTAATPKAS